MHRFLIIAILSVLCTIQLCIGQVNPFCFNHLKAENGLSNNTILKIMIDSKGFMWFATRDGLNRYDGYQYKIFMYDPQNLETSLGNNYTVSLYEDRTGNIWVGTIEGLYVYNSEKEIFSKFSTTTNKGVGVCGKITAITGDLQGNIWIADYAHGLFQYNLTNSRLQHFGHSANKNSLSSNDITSICVDKDNSVWIGVLGLSNGGLNLFSAKDSSFQYFSTFRGGINKIVESDDNNLLIGTPASGVYTFNRATNEVKSFFRGEDKITFVTDILVNPDEIWVGTSTGLYICNRQNSGYQKLSTNFYDKSSLSNSEITSIVKDRDGGIWIGTFTGGVNYLPQDHKTFDKFYPQSDKYGLTGKEVRGFCEDGKGNLYIATDDKDLNYFNPETNQFKHVFNQSGIMTGDHVTTILIDGDKLWIGYLGKGLDEIEIKSGKKTNYIPSGEDTSKLNDNSALALCKDIDDNIWIGSTKGANRYNVKTKNFSVIIGKNRGDFIYDILEDHDQLMWFASYGNGICNYNPRTKEWISFHNKKGDDTSLGFDRTIDLFEDSRNNIWVSTEGGGVSKYSKKTKQFKTYTTTEGLPNNVVYKILEDDNGMLWMSTNKGLTCFDPNTELFKNYSFSNGPLSDQFCHQSGIKTKDGRIYFGGIEGFVRFNPKEIKSNTSEPPIVLTGFQIFNKDVVVSEKDSPIKQTIVNAPTINLNYKQSNFSFNFAALSYNASNTNKYAYKMEGYENDWTYLKENRRITYSNLPSGSYRFRVIGANSDGIWNKQGQSVEIIIAPAPWLSIYAIIGYIILTVAFLYYLFCFYKRNVKNKRRRLIDNMNFSKDKAIYEAKINFFTTVAHEIKTPLTLIKAPYEQLTSSKNDAQEYADNIEIMGENIDRLLILTNQILDFSKLENQGFFFKYTQSNVNQIVENVLHRFITTFKHKNLDIVIELQKPEIISYIDSESFTKIVSNLVSNATKFANKKIIIKLSDNRTANGCFILRTTNDGPIIASEHRESVFKTFYQVPNNQTSEGFGIGLSIVKHLVDLHKGRVYLDETVIDMTSFVVEIPLMLEVNSMKNNHKEKEELIIADSKDELTEGRILVLVVEDDKSMLNFLKKLLSKTYTVITACDGEDAIRSLDKKMADIIVSDVMMPNMDGFSLCREIKKRIDYSHIPIILLTAKSNSQSKIEGMEVGADAYVEKPFSPEFLLAQIANILHNKRLLKEAFLKSPFTLTNTIANSSEDERFLTKVNEKILNHLSNESFSIDQMAEELNMGRSSLYRKIKGIVNLTPNDFTRLIRLKKAAEMLEKGDSRINEICYLTGFKSPSYFAKCFQKQFGVLPKDFAKKKS